MDRIPLLLKVLAGILSLSILIPLACALAVLLFFVFIVFREALIVTQLIVIASIDLMIIIFVTLKRFILRNNFCG